MRNSILRIIRVGVAVLWIAQALVGCASGVHVEAGPTAATAGGSPTQLPGTGSEMAKAQPAATAMPTATALPTATAAPTIDPGIITPQNAGRLVELRQLGRGSISGVPMFTPDGRGLLLPTTTGVYRYETSDFQQSKSRRIIPGGVYWATAIAPDGVTLALGSRLYDISGAEGRELPGPELPEELKAAGQPEVVSFSADGRLLGLGYAYEKQQTAVFERASGKPVCSVDGELVQFSPDGLALVVKVKKPDAPEYQAHFRVYEARGGKLLREWQGERAVFLAGRRLAVEAGGFTRIYDLASGRAVQAIDGRFADFSADGQVAAMFFANEARLVRVADRKVLARMKGSFPTADEVHLRIAPDGKTLAGTTIDHTCCGGFDARLTLWNAENGEVIFQEDGLHSIAFAPDGQSIFTSSLSVNAVVRRTSDGRAITKFGPLNSTIIGVAFVGNGQELVAATYGGDKSPLLFYLVESGEQVAQIHTQINGYDYGVAARPDGRMVALSNDFWDPVTGDRLPKLTGKMVDHFHFAAIGVAFSADSRRVATGALEGNLQVWDIAGESLVMEQTVCEGIVASVAFAPDGQSLALACTDVMREGQQAVQVWGMDGQGKRLMELKASLGNFARVAYSRDGKVLAAAGSEVRAWNAEDGSVIFTQPKDEIRPDNRAQSLAVSADAQMLAVGWLDGTVELWEITSGKKLATLPGAAYNPVHGVAFSPDGKVLAVGLDDGAVKIWGVK